MPFVLPPRGPRAQVAARDARARAIRAAAGRAGVFAVTSFGAVGDGKTLATAAIQKAIDACSAAGGGLVVVPPGRYLSGALFLRSHVHLHLEAGATLLASQRFSDFPAIEGRWEGVECKIYASLLTGVDLEGVTITGPGELEGQGSPWWAAHAETRKLRVAAGLKREQENPPGSPLKWPRPRLINLIRCQRVLIGDVQMTESPSYAVHIVYCQNVRIENVTVLALHTSNVDGLIIDSCRDVRVSDCSIGSGSDCIGVKAGFGKDGRDVAISSEDIVVTNCHLHSSGGTAIAIGSETSGGIRNVTISNSTISKCHDGIYIKSARGRGGVVEGVRVSNLVMGELVRAAVIVSTYFDSILNNSTVRDPNNPETNRTAKFPVDEGTPTIRHIDVDGVSAFDLERVLVVEGLPERFLQNLRFQNIVAGRVKTGVTLSRARGVSVSGLSVDCSPGPLVQASDVDRLELHRMQVAEPSRRDPVIDLADVNDAFIHGCDVGPGAPRFISAERCRGLMRANNRAPSDADPAANVKRP